jgi:hypothetical protein
MRDATKHIRHGVGSVRPYLYGRLDMLELVKRVFGAVELERLEVGKGLSHRGEDRRLDDSDGSQ